MACHLRAVGNKKNEPYTAFTPYCWNANCPNPGTTVEFLQATLKLMNCTMEVITQDVGADDSIDMIANGSSDISLLALRQTLDRMEKVDFTQPVNFLYYGYLIKEIPQLKVEDYILASFQLGALGLLVASGLFVGALTYLFTKLFHYSEGGLIDWMILCCQAFLNQFSCSLRGPIAGHLLIGFWLYFCMLITSSYQAKLKSFLTLSHARGTLFTELDGLIEADYIMVYQENGYTPLLWCRPDQCDRLLKIPKNKIVNLPPEVNLENYVYTHNKRVAFMAWTYDVDRYPISYRDYKKHLLFVRDSIAEPDFLAFVVNKNNHQLREQLNLAVLTVNPGYPNIRARYMQEFYPYQSISNVKKEITVLSLSHLVTLFRTCGEILIAAVITFILGKGLSIIKKNYQSFSYGTTDSR